MYDIFSVKDFNFPKGFEWGSATAGHQIEGMNCNSDYWHDEQEKLKANPEAVVSGMACNHYNMVDEDVNLISELGHRVYRMSIEWARIEPEEGRFSKEATEHYIRELELLKSKGIKIFVTLVHFTIPQWFKKIGWVSDMANLKYFERYLRYIVPLIKDYVDYWNVFNEFNLHDNVERKLNFVRYHARGYHIIKEFSDAPVSTSHALVLKYPYRKFDKADNLMAEYKDYTDNEFFFHAMRTGELVHPFTDGGFYPEIKDTVDYWSINTYVRAMIDARKANLKGDRYNNKKLDLIKSGFYLNEIYPEGMLHNLTRLTDKPVIISENGCSCDDDRWRIIYLTLFLSALEEAIKCGIDVRGYLYWSTMDNYEWGSFKPRFGLVEVDFETFKRTPRPSAYFYKEIIENNGFSQEILRKYLKDIPTLNI